MRGLSNKKKTRRAGHVARVEERRGEERNIQRFDEESWLKETNWKP